VHRFRLAMAPRFASGPLSNRACGSAPVARARSFHPREAVLASSSWGVSSFGQDGVRCAPCDSLGGCSSAACTGIGMRRRRTAVERGRTGTKHRGSGCRLPRAGHRSRSPRRSRRSRRRTLGRGPPPRRGPRLPAAGIVEPGRRTGRAHRRSPGSSEHRVGCAASRVAPDRMIGGAFLFAGAAPRPLRQKARVKP
jgi:hypothetical protein